MSDDAKESRRSTWPKCVRCHNGRMEPWRGTDGHSGSEWFYTCDRCGRTA